MLKKFFIFTFLFLLVFQFSNLQAATINGVDLENSEEILNLLKSYNNVALKYENGQYYYRQVTISNGEYQFGNSGIWSAFPYDYEKFIIIQGTYGQFYGYFLESDVEVIFKNNNFYSYVEKQTVRSDFHFASNFMSGFSNPILQNDMALFHSALIPSGGIKNVYSSFDVYDESGNLALKGYNPFTGEGASKELIVNFSYYNDYTKCHITADLKNGDFSDKIYYSTIPPSIVDGSLEVKQELPKAGIDLNYNTILYFQAEDSEGNIIDTKSININKLNLLSPDLFKVSVNFSKNLMPGVTQCEVIPSLDLKVSGYDIYYKISDIESDSATGDIRSSTNHLATTFTYIDNNTKMVYWNGADATFLLTFQIKNHETGSIALTKTVQIHLSKDSINGGDIIGGSTNGEDDPSISDDFNNSFGGLNENSSLSDFLNAAKSSLSIIGECFKILPGYIWRMFSVILIICIALRILGR